MAPIVEYRHILNYFLVVLHFFQLRRIRAENADEEDLELAGFFLNTLNLIMIWFRMVMDYM